MKTSNDSIIYYFRAAVTFFLFWVLLLLLLPTVEARPVSPPTFGKSNYTAAEIEDSYLPVGGRTNYYHSMQLEFESQLKGYFIDTVGLDSYGLRVYSVVFYGAVGNDPGDGSGTDDYTALAATYAACLQVGSIFYVPAATAGLGYRSSTKLTMSKNIKIQGDGTGTYPFYTVTLTPTRAASAIFYTRNDNQCLAFTTAGTVNRYPVFSIKDLYIKCVSSSTPINGSAGMYVDSNLQNWKVENTMIEGFYIDAQIESAFTYAFENCTFLGPIKYCVQLRNSLANDLGGWNFEHCRFMAGFQNPNTASGIYCKGAGGGYISKCNFNAQNTTVVATTFVNCFVLDFSDGVTSEFKFIDSDFNNYQTSGILITNTSGTPSTIQVNTCSFAPQNTSAGPAIDIRGGASGHILAVTLDNISGQNTPGTSSPFVNIDYVDGIKIGLLNPRAGNWTGGTLVATNFTGLGMPMNVSAVNTVSPTSPNRTITVEILGTTYYIAAKTTNN